jgi:hypothetical protein
MKASHSSLTWPAMLAMLVLGGCESGPSIRSFPSPHADLSAYRSYNFSENADTDASSSDVAKYLRVALEREMQSRGYRRSDSPDLLVNFHLQTEDKLTVSTSPASYYGWRGGYHWAANPVRDDEITSYTEGTLNVDLIDRARNELVWEGVAIGRIKDQALENPEPAVAAVIAQIFQQYPVPAVAKATR